MARRSRGSLVALLTGLVLAACTAAGDDQTTTTAGAETTTSTAVEPTTSIAPAETSTTDASFQLDVDVSVPDGEGPFPAVVLVHGGGWVAGSPGLMQPLATLLNENGFLTVNTQYTLATLSRAAYPAAVEDVACAVRLAADHPDSDGTVALVGHSAGAHIGALVALTGDDFEGGCTIPGSGVPDRFIGLAGPYDVSRLGLAVAAFFGGGPDRFAEAWEAGNPQLLADRNPELASLIIYGAEDRIVPETFAVDFHDALVAAGSDSVLEIVEGARHNELRDPEVVGDLILTWLAPLEP